MSIEEKINSDFFGISINGMVGLWQPKFSCFKKINQLFDKKT